MTNESYPVNMSLLGHKERLSHLIGTYDRVTNVVNYAENQVAIHQFSAQDGRYVQDILLQLINYHKHCIAALESDG